MLWSPPRYRRAGDADHVHRRLGQRVFLPRGAVVRRAKHLSLAGAKANLFGILTVNRHPERRALGADAVVDTLPNGAQIRRAHHAAGFTGEVQPHTGVQGVGGVGRRLHTARVSNGTEALQMQIFPGLPAVVVSGGATHLQGCEHVLWIAGCHGKC